MASIVLSFVGSQDPYSNTTKKLGSIVSLISHLQGQGSEVKRVILLHTATTAQNAIDTQEWLLSEQGLAAAVMTLVPVSEALSQDPINQRLAVQEIRQVLAQVQSEQTDADILEFNASSGTPAMKSAWGILQASGYVQRSHLWQVRNPDQVRAGQVPIFRDDVTVLKDEFDLQVIKRQVQDYNYSGALATLQATRFATDDLVALLNYGFYRLSLDFDRAYHCLSTVTSEVNPEWLKELAPLRQKQKQALLKEAYFNALIKLQNQRYAEFLVMLSGLQENVLRFLVTERIGLSVSGKYGESDQAWQQIRDYQAGQLYQYLQTYRLPKGGLLRVNAGISRYVLIAIAEFHPQFADVVHALKALNDYCDRRNDAVHEFAGVSELEDEAQVLVNLRKVIKQVAGTPNINPFDRLNVEVCHRLETARLEQ